jgi:S-adenosylmethionine:tRNA ribosyltransferase-isomerase
MDVKDFDYELPEELIAQKPVKNRDESRLMIVDREKGTVSHKHFFDIIDYLEPGDCLVFNDSKVIPARIFGVKEGTGGKIEFLLIKNIGGDRWESMVRPGKRLQKGDRVLFGIDGAKYADFCDVKGSGAKNPEMLEIESTCPLAAEVTGYGEDGTRIVEFEYKGVFPEVLDRVGMMPLPPYIDRDATDEDKEWYQTVYARHDGSAAAPTAGLHFTKELIERIESKGVKTAYVTLHVGIGTFRPVNVDKVEDHHMHFEEYTISEEDAGIINAARREGGRIISVGTTSTRTLESAAVLSADEAEGKEAWEVKPGSGSTDIFIYPGYEFKMVDCLITNFHLPKSTLLMLISALYDREKILEVYEEAVREKYRFFSYGDAMFIL